MPKHLVISTRFAEGLSFELAQTMKDKFVAAGLSCYNPNIDMPKSDDWRGLFAAEIATAAETQGCMIRLQLIGPFTTNQRWEQETADEKSCAVESVTIMAAERGRSPHEQANQVDEKGKWLANGAGLKQPVPGVGTVEQQIQRIIDKYA